jgi:nicotinate-nucleotide adenylyltransferase
MHPGAELFVIVGWDVSAELGTWERLDEVRDTARLVVVNRPGTPPPVGLRQLGWRLEQVSVPNLEISSTDLRARAADGRPLDYLVPEAAVRVIRQRGLYSVIG